VTTELYWLLTDLHARHGRYEFGKIVQKLLAIGFRFAGFPHIVERGVQGVDVDAADDSIGRYSTEVKTTQKAAISFAVKDRKGLAARQQDGYQPVLAVLRLSPLSDLLLVHAAPLRCGRLQIASLGPFRINDLELRIQPCFARAVREHFEGALRESQFYLDRVLREYGIEVTDPVTPLPRGPR